MGRYQFHDLSSVMVAGTRIIRIKNASTKIATATVKFNPPFESAPHMSATLISSPYDDSSEISAKPGTAGLRGCNIHLNCNAALKVGEYVFEFLAKSQ